MHQLTNSETYSIDFSTAEEKTIDLELIKLLPKNVIRMCSREKGWYIFPTFVRPKDDGTCKFIVKLKKLNEEMPYIHFKMETLESVWNHIIPGCYLSSVDLKDANYSIPIFPNHEKYEKFAWKGQLHQFPFLPIWLCSGLMKCIKLMKFPVTVYRRKCHVIAIYIDGLINVGYTHGECRNNFLC